MAAGEEGVDMAAGGSAQEVRAAGGSDALGERAQNAELRRQLRLVGAHLTRHAPRQRGGGGPIAVKRVGFGLEDLDACSRETTSGIEWYRAVQSCSVAP